MERFEESSIWKKTLGKPPKADIHKDVREELRGGFKNFREKAKAIAGEIALTFPGYTLHDITHIDALWETAGLVMPDNFDITPTEAFVLGGAFLIHDLGMGLAAFPGGMEDLKKEEIWKDTAASLFREKNHRIITEEDYSKLDAETEKLTTEKTLRAIHARKAEKLAFTLWKDICLIEDDKLREYYGRIIGLIACSHGAPVRELESKLQPIMGAPGDFPPEWTVDPVKLACILRIADAIHIDSSRAPSFPRTIKKISGFSDSHWNFQGKLTKPTVGEDGRLIFTSTSSFSREEIDSWWLCFDTLQMIDNDLKAVNALLADTKRQRLKTTGVAFIDDAKRLAEHITVDGWEPVDAKIKVTNVPELVSRLGGKELYGDDLKIPLRELIQNASDAIRARRILDKKKPEFGDITIRFGKDESGQFIEVEDNGTGMSPKVLTGPLLDFGGSFWGTTLMHEELPGLESKGYASTGQYGIGFFSVFMWSRKVNVYSRRYEKGRDSTHVLEFSNGAFERPILRKADKNESIADGGTSVRVWLDTEVMDTLLGKDEEDDEGITAAELIESLCPGMDCNVFLEEEGSASERIIEANDWITMPPLDLIKRIMGESKYDSLDKSDKQYLLKISENMTLLEEDGKKVGRLALYDDDYKKNSLYDLGTATIGGLRSSELSNLSGILVGESVRVSRDSASPIVSSEKMKEWATNQANLVSKLKLDPVSEINCAKIVYAFKGNTSRLKIAQHKNGFLNYKELKRFIREAKHDSFLLIDDSTISVHERMTGSKIDLFDNVIIANALAPFILADHHYKSYFSWPVSDDGSYEDYFFTRSLLRLVIEAFSETWGIDADAILTEDEEGYSKVPVGKADGKDAALHSVYVLKKIV